MSVALRGNLEDFGIGEVFQLIGQQRKTGVLEVSRDGERVRLCFDAGAIVSAAPAGSHDGAALGEMLVRTGCLTREALEEAERDCAANPRPFARALFEKGGVSVPQIEAIEDLLTRETLFDLLRWKGGAFHFRAQAVAHERASGSLIAAEQFLMDGLRMVDEWRSLQRHVPSEETVFRRVGSLSRRPLGTKELSSREQEGLERVLLLVDGRLTVRRVIDLSRLGTFEATSHLARCVRDGLLAALSPEELKRARRRQRVAPPPPPLLRAVVHALPFAVAGLVTLAAVFCRFAPAPPRPIRPALAAAHASWELLRVRNALEARHLSRGTWPDALDALAGEGFLRPDALTLAPARSYYYSEKPDGALVLAPDS
jgi:hypothetical protein